MRLILTDHAAVRYAERVRPDLTVPEVRALLAAALTSAALIREFPNGKRQFALTDPPCIVVSRPGRYAGEEDTRAMEMTPLARAMAAIVELLPTVDP